MRCWLLLLTACPTACVATAYPPAYPADPVQVYLLKQGEHTGVVLPAEAVQDAAWVEYAFGDWDWYVEDRTSAIYGMYTLITPGGSALGRRYSSALPEADAKLSERGASVYPFLAERELVRVLRQELDEEYAAAGVIPRELARSGLLIVPARESYSLTYNCSDATIVWLRRLGCSVPIGGITRSIVLGPVQH